MFVCLGCDAQFDAPYIYDEHHGFILPPFERWEVCPYCGDSSIEEVRDE